MRKSIVGASGFLRLALIIFGWVGVAFATDLHNLNGGDWEKAVNVFPKHIEIGSDNYSVKRAVSDGEELFRARFTWADGFGRPHATGDSKPTPRISSNLLPQRLAGPDANSCFGCHNQPFIGGSGDFAANVFVGAHFSDPPTNSIDITNTSERNTTDLFGTGAIEVLAKQITSRLHVLRDSALLKAKTTGELQIVSLAYSEDLQFGKIVVHPNGYIDYSSLEGVDYDLVVKPFGIKGVATSLREFTIAALNQHHGIQAIERFGWERTGIKDFDRDGVEIEFSIGQVTALVLFQAALPTPLNYVAEKDSQGQIIFEKLGCNQCHITKLRLESNVYSEPNYYNRPGNLRSKESHTVSMELKLPKDATSWYIEPFTDLKRHNMCDEEINFLCNEVLRQDNVKTEEFMTSRLWNLANTSPFCHRGDCITLNQAILVHGGEARKSRDLYSALPRKKKKVLVSYLKSFGDGLSFE